MWRRFQQGLHPKLISLFVALGPRCAHARALIGIEHAELNPRRVAILCHHAAQCIDFAHHVTFCQTANRRVARHLPNRVQILREQQCIAAEPGRCGTRLNPGVSGTDHNHIKALWVGPHKQKRGEFTSERNECKESKPLCHQI